MNYKRAFDKAASGLGLLALWVPMRGIAHVMSKITGGSPYYETTRLGIHAQPFSMFKIRTMRELKPGEKASVDERTSVLGKYLRKTHLDELPQLFNIWRGEMSFVGPRPISPNEPVLSEYQGRAAKRFTVLPGLTGLAQLENMKSITQEEALRLDLTYVANNSFKGDMKILALTLPCIFKNRNVPHYVPVLVV